MNSPLKQYRQYLLIPAILCTSSLLLFSVIKGSSGVATATAKSVEVPVVHTVDSAHRDTSSGDTIPTLSIPQVSTIDNRSPVQSDEDPALLNVVGEDRALLFQPTQAFASVVPLSGTPTSAIYPVAYTWEPAPSDPFSARFSNTGITSTMIITYATVGVKVINVTAGTSAGDVTVPFTIPVSVRSIPISSFQTTRFRYNEFDGTGIRVVVPGQTIAETIQLDYLPIGTIGESRDQGSTGLIFELNAYQNQSYLSAYTFEQPIDITLVYDDGTIMQAEESLLTLRRWQSTTPGEGQWVEVSADCETPSVYERDLEMNQLSVKLCTLGQFALFGVVSTTFVPVIR